MVTRLAVPLLAVAAAFAGCGGDEAAVQPQADASPSRMASPEPAPSAAPEKPSGKAEAIVEMKGFEYLPARVEVAQGGRVTWKDRDRSNHTVTFEEDGQPGVDNLRPGQSETVRFKESGTFSYVCDYHPTMRGTVEVR